MTSYIMAIDQGTTSTRAILFDKASNIVGVAQKELENYYPYPGWVEQNANDIWASTIGVMFEVLAKTGVKDTQIAAIGITNQRRRRLSGIRKAVSRFILRSSGSPGNRTPIAKS